jgi:hypothetical protein
MPVKSGQKGVFSVPSGSARAERIFSTADLLSRNNHMSLKPQTLAKLVFVEINSKALSTEPNNAFFCFILYLILSKSQPICAIYRLIMIWFQIDV